MSINVDAGGVSTFMLHHGMELLDVESPANKLGYRALLEPTQVVVVGLDDKGLEEQIPFELLQRVVDRVALLLYGRPTRGCVAELAGQEEERLV